MEATRFLTCACCATRIGTYEPLWWKRPDGTLAPTSLLRAREDPEFETAGSSFFHQACLAAANGDAAPA
jgi:hypothetical protein